jgi:hypothetical protein
MSIDPHSTATITVEPDANGVRVRADRPGIAAVSGVVDPRELIQQVAQAAGLIVTISDGAQTNA